MTLSASNFLSSTFAITLLSFLVGTTSALLFPSRLRRVLSCTLSALGSVAAATGALAILIGNESFRLVVPQLLPFGGTLLNLDALGAYFILVIAIVAVPASIYAIGYTKHELSGRVTQAMLPLFLLSMVLVVCAASITTFLFCWELMAITSLILVIADHRHEDTRTAGIWYAAMTHLGFLAVFIGFAILGAHAPLGTFGVLSESSLTLSPALRTAAFLLFFFGFASKAGVVPFHVWLPRAHAEAPSHVSALMSGAMVKMGIYGILRVCWDVLGTGERWWYLLILSLGIISALFGILHAMTSSDIKRLLAYSTTENIGLILIAIGAAGIYKVGENDLMAGFAIAAALMHVLNHAIFKGLLFLSAGSVLHSTRLRDLDRLGGLARRMPFTTLTFALGALAIAAVPPLNGFASEWMMLQSLMHGIPAESAYSSVFLPIAVGAMALAGGLVAATFVKAFGTGFLALPRSPEADQATEVGFCMKLGQLLLAIACVLFGIGAGALSTPVTHAVASMRGLFAVDSITHERIWLQLPGGTTLLSPLFLGVALLSTTIITFLVLRFLRSPSKARVAATWACGRELQTPRMEYTATSFAEPLLRVFHSVLRTKTDVNVDHRAESEFFVKSVHFSLDKRDIVERRLYAPLLQATRTWGEWGRAIQNGSIHRYLAYVLISVLFVLVVAR